MTMKSRRPAKVLVVSAGDRIRLESIARSQSLPAALVRRAQMILCMADGESKSTVARRFRVTRPTVDLWRTRYRERGVSGLHNEPKATRPRTNGDDAIAKLADLRRQIKAFVDHYHQQPLMWITAAESIVAELDRLCRVMYRTPARRLQSR
jgi:transposase